MSEKKSYMQIRVELKDKIIAILNMASRREVGVDLEKMKAQLSLDYGVGERCIEGIIEKLKTLGLLEINGNSITKKEEAKGVM